MKLDSISLCSFRCYDSLDISFNEGINAILGGNGSGKSSLAEAIYYLSLGRSWRSDDDSALIAYGEEGARIEACFSEGALRRNLVFEISKQRKRVFLNEKPLRRLSELASLLNIMLFVPTDVTMFKGPPSVRRSFLDTSLVKQSKEYLSFLSEYGRLLKERNILLKSESVNLPLLDVLTQRMIEAEKGIVRYRTLYIKEANEAIRETTTKLFGENRVLQLDYSPFVKGDGEFLDLARAAHEKAKENDLFRKTTTIGVHREDFAMLLDGKDVSVYGSQGENRLAAIILKLVPYRLIKEKDKKPIAVLDDILSELDSVHEERLLALLQEQGQCFLTATKKNIIGASCIDVLNHKATRRN